jgi:hypothetical protein
MNNNNQYIIKTVFKNDDKDSIREKLNSIMSKIIHISLN